METTNSQQTLTKLLPSVTIYSFIVYLFVSGLVNPESHINFIYNVGIFVFVTEFLSVHSAIMLSSPKWKFSQKAMLVGFYAFFVLAISLATNTFYPAILFMLSLAAKTFGRPPQNQIQLIWPVVIFMCAVGLSVLFASAVSALFSFPPEVIAQKPAGSSGLFVEQPQSLLLWGILYYGGLVGLDIWQYLRIKK